MNRDKQTWLQKALVSFVYSKNYSYNRVIILPISGIVAVYSSQQFVEQLGGVKVYLGEPAELRCRLEPWVSGNTPEEETTITWYHFDTVLTPELQERFGITTECNSGQCILRINKTSKRYGGIYKCVAKNKFGICTTSCRLLLDCKSFFLNI